MRRERFAEVGFGWRAAITPLLRRDAVDSHGWAVVDAPQPAGEPVHRWPPAPAPPTREPYRATCAPRDGRATPEALERCRAEPCNLPPPGERWREKFQRDPKRQR